MIPLSVLGINGLGGGGFVDAGGEIVVYPVTTKSRGSPYLHEIRNYNMYYNINLHLNWSASIESSSLSGNCYYIHTALNEHDVYYVKASEGNAAFFRPNTIR